MHGETLRITPIVVHFFAVSGPTRRAADHGDVVAVGVVEHEEQRGAGRLHGLGSSSMPPIALEPFVLAEDVGRLDADRPPPGLAAHRRVEGQPSLEPGGATSTQRISLFSPKRTSARTSKPSFSV